jgi:hypothetical protein
MGRIWKYKKPYSGARQNIAALIDDKAQPKSLLKTFMAIF